MNHREILQQGKTSLGIEFGSTRIKAVLIDETGHVLASGGHTWADTLQDGVWTYRMDQVIEGLQSCYQDLKQQVKNTYGVTLSTIGSIGISAMMHGYLPFDEGMNLLTPFRTWRNTITGPAAKELTDLFQFNSPQRWSIAHLHQAILNGEEHVKDVRFFTTLAGYVHYLLSGEKVLGIGDAAGMFPIDSTIMDYDQRMLQQYQEHIASKNYPWSIREILPKTLVAGENAGRLTDSGARLLDPDGDLTPGIPLCPPEGDAGTGMTATNSVGVRTGNVSAGTSIFAMVVLEKALSRLHTEIDMVTTPTGLPVAMVHCNTCTSDLNAWAGLFAEFARAAGHEIGMNELFPLLFNSARDGEKDAGGLISFNYYSGEPVTGCEQGVPMFVRRPDSPITLSSFMRSLIYSSVAALSIGMRILTEEEKASIDKILGHGGLFKTPEVGQSILAAAIGTPVTVMETASEGGAWGIALLAAYMNQHAENETLDAWLDTKIFAGMPSTVLAPKEEDVAGFNAYIGRYAALLDTERLAAKTLM